MFLRICLHQDIYASAILIEDFLYYTALRFYSSGPYSGVHYNSM